MKPIEKHPISLRHSGRVVRQPNRYMGIGDALVVISDDNKDDPLTLGNVMKDEDSNTRQQAMNLKMESMYSNQVWELVDCPKE